MKKIIIYLIKLNFPLHTQGVRGQDLLGIGTLLGNVATGVMNTFDNKANRRQQREQNQLDRDFTLQQWERENAYNSPKAQMARLKEGGLNPNLVYGGGATTLSAHSNVPDSKPLPPLNTASIGAGLTNGINQMIDVKRAQADINLTNLQAGLAAVNTDYQKQNREYLLNRMSNTETDTDLKILAKKTGEEKFSILQKTGAQMAESTLRKMSADATNAEINSLTLPEKNKLVLQDAYWRMKVNASRYTGQELQNQLNQIRNNLVKTKGINLSDSIWFRIFQEFLPEQQTMKGIQHHIKTGR